VTDELTPTRRIFEELMALPPYRRQQAYAVAARDAFAVWQRWVEARGGADYAERRWPPAYMDGVVGGSHVVDLELPARALAECERYLRGEPVDAKATAKAYYEPIVAMQDEDLELPTAITYAYYAIYNLHELVFSDHPPDPEHVVLRQVASALNELGTDVDAWIREWRTRVWDAWATTPLAPDETPLPPAVTDALRTGDWPRALAALPDEPSCLRAVLLGLADRRSDALDVAHRALRVDPDDRRVRAWVEDNLYALAPPDVLAVSPTGIHVALALGDAWCVHARRLGYTPSGTLPGRVRRVGFSPDGLLVLVAGELVDELGAWATRVAGADLDDREGPGYHADILGPRIIAALGPHGALVPVDPHRAMVLRANELDVLGDAQVVGAAFDPAGDFVATHDGERVSIWRRDGVTAWPNRDQVHVATFAIGAVTRVILAAPGRVLVLRADAPAVLRDF